MRPDHSFLSSAADLFFARRGLGAFVALGALWMAACGPTPGPDTTGPTGSGSSPSSGVGGANGVGGAGEPLGSGGGLPTGAGGAGPGAGSGGSGNATGSGGEPGVHYDHCKLGYLPDPSDSDPSMQDGPSEYVEAQWPDQVDLTVQPQVLQYMEAHHWEAAHVEWHAIRGCSSGLGNTQSHINICNQTQMIPVNQNCRDRGDGYEFLVFHHHMIVTLQQLWPNHKEQFTAFPRFPTVDDLPQQWKSRLQSQPWSANELASGAIGDDIANNVDLFGNEGELGYWLQCFYNATPTAFSAPNMPWVGLHFSLHDKWNHANNTRHGLNNGEANIDNYMFWKLHGWIDNVWLNYRTAIGKPAPEDDPVTKADLEASCREMDAYIALLGDEEPVDPNAPLPEESGVFHEQVRPLFENQTTRCSGCHGPTKAGAAAALRLGGHISSADIVLGLLNADAIGGGQYKLVVPGKPLESWLYLKAAGLAAAPPSGSLGACQGTMDSPCRTGVMPPSGGSANEPVLTPTQLQTLYAWIESGAPAPTSP